MVGALHFVLGDLFVSLTYRLGPIYGKQEVRHWSSIQPPSLVLCQC